MPREYEPGAWELLKGEFISGSCSGKPVKIEGPAALVHVREFPELNLVSIGHYKGTIELDAPTFLSAVQKLQTPK